MTDFSTIDRLMEFGLGMGIAQQMINTMNQSFNNMPVAGVDSNVKMPRALENAGFYAVIDNNQAGPFTEDELKIAVAKRLITLDTLMWNSGMTGWRQAKYIPSVYKMIIMSHE